LFTIPTSIGRGGWLAINRRLCTFGDATPQLWQLDLLLCFCFTSALLLLYFCITSALLLSSDASVMKVMPGPRKADEYSSCGCKAATATNIIAA
jgi:hypothetical protein